ncbi:MAG: GspE/PulE family protein, partial [Vampirovibrionales bacterium]|nr:GspE/PulE family protein [Vampirovibrionales bacterium]
MADFKKPMGFNFAPSAGASASVGSSVGASGSQEVLTMSKATAAGAIARLTLAESMVAPSPLERATAGLQSNPVVSERRIGDILIENQSVTPQQLQQALSEARATGKPVGSVLMTLGYVTEQELGRALAEKHGMEYVDLSNFVVDVSLLKLLPENFATSNLVVPLSFDPKKRLFSVVVARPEQVKALEQVVVLTGYHFIGKIGTYSGIVNCLNRLAKDNRASSAELLAQLDEELTKKDSIYASDDADTLLQAELASESTPLVQLVNSLLIRAIDANASDIHIEPQQQRLLVRFRINGILHEKESFPKKLSAPLVSRIKVASGMDIAERRRPQDGRMKIKVGVQEVDMRVSSMAVMHGEKIVIRIQKPNATSGGLVKLGLPEFALPSIQKMIHAPHGIVLVTGPTGSGKTTTLYSCLREINTSERNISTIEDPVEYPLAGINQTQVSQKAGLTFASCLRSLLRQDPDVILVGEIR